MKKIVVASKNPVKIQAIEIGFAKMFPDEIFEVTGVSVSSDVPNQPIGDDQTFTGAKNRVDNAGYEIKDADFYVGIEGGVSWRGEEMEVFAWVLIKSFDKYGKAKTGTFFLPKEIVDLVKDGKELGEADDIVFNRQNSKQANGAVGILTGDIIDRTKYYVEAVVLALIPFKNPELY